MATAELTSAPLAPAVELHRPLDWYKDIVIYQLHVRSFYDSNGDGIGDFAGLTQKLDYVASLGATAVWLLPFYPSPLKDEGYDIADYRSINPMYGTLDDFRKFLESAHRLGLSVITELVVNHTSDQHPWFQRARRAPKGSPERDFYVWSDTDDRYLDARIIFTDFETSNWTWDRLAHQYFWHRFYSHQPDLNFDNPAVQDAVIEVLDFWFAMGIDGLRLDAVPYLYERDGTNCENLPETHAFLRRLRKHVDERFPGRMLLAEANQWPDETVAYFGANDECHMCFNFPLMPRLFMAVQEEERFPIVDILQQTPSPPQSSQWAIFLRNHDELTLEMVTDEERDAMLRSFATDPQARINLGVRRRLAPLLNNDRRRLELMYALLLSLPGTPVMYYGDEICMGDNIYLRDRDSVRTPMQWSFDRNAGFSSANPQRLFLPPIVDPAFHYEAQNVETQEQSPNSLLWWLRRVIRIRQRYLSFGRGDIEFLFGNNPRILAFIRRFQDETLLIVANLSRLSQYVELNLAAFHGRIPVELFGENRFPLIGDLPYLLTLGPRGFYWFRLDWPQGEEARRVPRDLPIVRIAQESNELFRPPALGKIRDAMSDYLRRQFWHLSPDRVIRSTEAVDSIPLGEGSEPGTRYMLVILRVDYTEGEPSMYQLALMATGEQRAMEILRDRPTAGAFHVVRRHGHDSWYVCDATGEREFWTKLVQKLAQGETVAGTHGRLEFRPAASFPSLPEDAHPSTASLSPAARARGAVMAVDKTLFMKLVRRVEVGIHPELEIGTAMADLPGKLAGPRLLGTWQYLHPKLGMITLGTAQEFVSHERSLAEMCREDLQRVLETASAAAPHAPLGESNASHGQSQAVSVDGQPASVLFAPIHGWFALLGRALADIHLGLASLTDNAAFSPEVFSALYRRSLYHGFRAEALRAFALLRDSLQRSELAHLREAGLDLLNRSSLVEQHFRPLVRYSTPLWRIRCHGAFELSDVLLTADQLQIVDWEGDPARPVTERRIKRSALNDLADLGRSLHCVTWHGAEAWLRQVGRAEDLLAKVASWSSAWYQAAISALIRSYREAVAGRPIVPDDPAEFAQTFSAFQLDAAIEDLLLAVEQGLDGDLPEVISDCRQLLNHLDRLDAGS